MSEQVNEGNNVPHYQGILVRKGSRARLVISVRIIQQAVCVELDADAVTPVR